MDAVPPDIVMVAPEGCADRLEADRLLRQALAPAAAPAAGWSVAVRIELVGSGLKAEATILDERGAPVAHRALQRERRECAPVGRALGVWGALVLDAEVERAGRVVPLAPPTPVTAASVTVWPEPASAEKANPEGQLFLVHPDDRRDLEFGASGFLMTSRSLGAAGGGSGFAMIEVGSGWFLRPMVMGARTVSTSPSGTLASSHFDVCRRLPGNYSVRRGMQADLCAGSDLGFFAKDGGDTVAWATLGPSFGLRGELGSALSVELRAMGAWLVPEPEVVARLELGLTWRAR